MAIIQSLAHRLVAHPFVYDLVQQAVGIKKIQARIATHIPALTQNANVVDIGGGTGIERTQFSVGVRYICLDIDKQKLDGYAAKFGADNAIQADGTYLPLQDKCADFTLMIFVTHHIRDIFLDQLIAENARVLKPTGTCLFVDPVWQPNRSVGRLLWRYDRGSYPRSFDNLHQKIAKHFSNVAFERFAVLHEYGLYIAKK